MGSDEGRWAPAALTGVLTVTVALTGCAGSGEKTATRETASDARPPATSSPTAVAGPSSTVGPSPSPTAPASDYVITCTFSDDATIKFLSFPDAWTYQQAPGNKSVSKCSTKMSEPRKLLPGELEARAASGMPAADTRQLESLLDLCARIPADGEDLGFHPSYLPIAAELCPNAPHITALQSGTTSDRVYNDGHYKVSTVRHARAIKPGTYRGQADARNCYWERTTSTGETIDNDIITYSPSGPVVTIRSGDGGFVSRNCGPWTRTS